MHRREIQKPQRKLNRSDIYRDGFYYITSPQSSPSKGEEDEQCPLAFPLLTKERVG
jgi:hypothetical protein